MHSGGLRNPCSHICTGELKYLAVRSVCITSGGTLGFRATPVEKHYFIHKAAAISNAGNRGRENF